MTAMMKMMKLMKIIICINCIILPQIMCSFNTTDDSSQKVLATENELIGDSKNDKNFIPDYVHYIVIGIVGAVACGGLCVLIILCCTWWRHEALSKSRCSQPLNDLVCLFEI